MTTPPTPLDAAHMAMEAAPEDMQARLRFYDRLAASELFVLLEAEAEGDRIAPRVFETESGALVLGFDREDRLSDFAGTAVPYAALSGRTLAGLLASAGLGLALNPEVAVSSHVMPPDAMAWLAETVSGAPQELEARPVRVDPPKGVPEPLIEALSGRLAAAAGLARCAWLAAVHYGDGSRGHLMGVAGAEAWAHAALSRTLREALVFSGLEAGALDVVFLTESDPLAAELARVGLRFDLPEPEASAEALHPVPPGMDPDSPPRLR